MDDRIRRRADQGTGSTPDGLTILTFKHNETDEELFVTAARNLPIPVQGEVVRGAVYTQDGNKEQETGTYVVVERGFSYSELSAPDQDPEHLSTMVTLWVQPNQ